MGGMTRLPTSARETFARASSDPYVHRLPLGYSPSPPTPEETRRPAVHLLRAAWELAIVEAKQRGVDPSGEVLSKIIEGDEGLLFIAKLPLGTPAAEILRRYTQDQSDPDKA
jgi:hypothetical protein